MSLATQYLLYLTVFRLGMITAGVITIVLGYRLFVRGVYSVHSSTQESLEARVGASRFTLKNAAPGTGFGLFGVMLITTMLIQGGPEFTYETLRKATADENAMTSAKLVMRGAGTQDRFGALVEKGVAREQAGDASGAIDAYKEALAGTILPINQLAGLYCRQGKLDDALPLAQLGVALNPNNADVLDTFAEILTKRGNRVEAEKWLSKAATLDSRYQSKLLGLRQTMR